MSLAPAARAEAAGVVFLRSSARYQRQLRRDESKTVALIRTYAEEQPMYGYRIIAAMLLQINQIV